MEIDSLDVLNPDKLDVTQVLRDSTKSLIGETYNKLTVTSFAGYHNDRAHWLCSCECGNIKSILGENLTSGKSGSCGCGQFSGSFKHGYSKHPLHSMYRGMIRRCHSSNAENYPLYGGRGIKVCERWRTSFEDFVSDMGERPVGHSIEREDNDGDYEPGNCRWATSLEQARNKRNTVTLTVGDVTKTLTQWSEETGVPIPTLRRRLTEGREPVDVISTTSVRRVTEVCLFHLKNKQVLLFTTLKNASDQLGLTYSTMFNRIKDKSLKPYRGYLVMANDKESAKYITNLLGDNENGD